jgi:hypothetical protein
MEEKYDLAALLKTPKQPLTKEQWNNFGETYMKMTNDDISAGTVDIEPAISRRIAEIRAKGTYCR